MIRLRGWALALSVTLVGCQPITFGTPNPTSSPTAVGATTMIVSHNTSIGAMADRVIRFRDGQMIEGWDSWDQSGLIHSLTPP